METHSPEQTGGHTPAYRFKKRKDGTLCIYTEKYDVLIAEFAKGTAIDAGIIEARLSALPEVVAAAEKILSFIPLGLQFPREEGTIGTAASDLRAALAKLNGQTEGRTA